MTVANIETDGSPWPILQKTALEQGFASMHATPMRIHDEVIGAMTLVSSDPGNLSDRDIRLIQALADLAILGILHERNFRQSHVISEQLHVALDTRILLEQAKGVLSEAEHLTVSEAFSALSRYARNNSVPLRSAAEGVINRTIPTVAVAKTSAS